ncbi:MAG: hypothetical protein AAF489_03525 [Bacteroidota bacterium]
MTEYRGFSSFISERTADYIIVPRLVSMLKSEFRDVVPLYPWLSREGGKLSRTLHADDSFRVLGLFTKRPKVSIAKTKFVVKVNNDFVLGASAARKLGIPFITGTPIVQDFWRLNENADCFWVKLNETTKDFYEIKANSPCPYSDNIIQSEEEMIEFVTNNSSEMILETLVRAIREVRWASGNGMYRAFGLYRPVYFLLR